MIEKMLSILRAYVFMLLYKAGFINDVNYKRVLIQRTSECENCILRKGNWCSRRRVTAIINDNGKKQTIKGCGCIWWVKIFDDTPDTCPLHRWEELNND